LASAKRIGAVRAAVRRALRLVPGAGEREGSDRRSAVEAAERVEGQAVASDGDGVTRRRRSRGDRVDPQRHGRAVGERRGELRAFEVDAAREERAGGEGDSVQWSIVEEYMIDAEIIESGVAELWTIQV
jgi:hypothetical protein